MTQKTAHPFDQAVANPAGALHRQAVQLLVEGRMGDGISLLEKALAVDPDSADIHVDLGTAYRKTGQPAKAEAHYAAAAKLAPRHPLALNVYGAFLIQQNRLDEAEPLLKSAYALKPGHYEISNNLGLLHYRRGNLPEAERFFAEALRLNPSWSIVHANLANLFMDKGRYDGAEQAFRNAIKYNASNAGAWSGLGHLYQTLGKEEDAIGCFQRAVTLDPGNVQAWLRVIGLLELLNRLEEASDAVARAKRHFPADPGIITLEAKLLRRAGRAAEAIPLLEKCIHDIEKARPGQPVYDGFFFELGGLYDRADNADKAFTCFARAHAERHADKTLRSFDKTAVSAEIALIRRHFTSELAKEPAVPQGGGQRAPVFLIGFPRSGTTLLDQILSSHPGVAVAEERPAVSRMGRQIAQRHPRPAEWPALRPEEAYPPTSCLLPMTAEEVPALRQVFFDEHAGHAAPGAEKTFIDKLPLNIHAAGLIKRVFPAARFILALRHPCDAVLSCFMQRFDMNPAMARLQSLEDAARFYDETFGLWDHYRKVMDLNVHTIRYEDVVANFQPTVASLLQFLGLDWNDAVLEYDKTARDKGRINTPSYHQVTEKIYTRASGRWQRYRKHMEPVLPILEPHALKHGYSMEET